MAAAASVVLAGVFGVIAMSVVSARRPLDRELERSFDRAAARSGGVLYKASPRGCRKFRVSYYACSVAVTHRRQHVTHIRPYLILLKDDGCWSTVRLKERDPLVAVPLSGCISSGG